MAKKLNQLTAQPSTPADSDVIAWGQAGGSGLAYKMTFTQLKAKLDAMAGGGDVTAPTVVSATVPNGAPGTVVVVFSESVTVTTAGWSFRRNTANWAVSSVAGSGTTWTFTMATSAASGETIDRSYDGSTGATVDGSGNELVSFTDSSVTNGVSGPSLVDIDFTTASNLTNSSGIWTGSGGANYNSNKGVSSVKIASGQDGWVQVEMDSTNGNDFVIQLSEASSNSNYDQASNPGGAVYVSGTNIYVMNDSGNPDLTSPGSIADGQHVRVIRTGSVWKVQKSTDGGGVSGTWTDVKTLTTSTTAAVYVHGFVGDTGKKIYYPKGYNVS